MFYVTPEYFRALRFPYARARFQRRTTARCAGGGQRSLCQNVPGRRRCPGPASGSGRRRPARNRWRGGRCPAEKRLGEDFGPLAPMPDIYIPGAQDSDKFMQLVHAWFSPSWIVRFSGPSQGVIAGMQRALGGGSAASVRRLPQHGGRALSGVGRGTFSSGSIRGAGGAGAAASRGGNLRIDRQFSCRANARARYPAGAGSDHGTGHPGGGVPGVALALAGVIAGSVLAGFASHCSGIWSGACAPAIRSHLSRRIRVAGGGGRRQLPASLAGHAFESGGDAAAGVRRVRSWRAPRSGAGDSTAGVDARPT